MAKRGSKGDYGCKVPKGGRRHGCGAGNKVFEIRKEVKKQLGPIEKRFAKRIAAYKKDIAKRVKK